MSLNFQNNWADKKTTNSQDKDKTSQVKWALKLRNLLKKLRKNKRMAVIDSTKGLTLLQLELIPLWLQIARISKKRRKKPEILPTLPAIATIGRTILSLIVLSQKTSYRLGNIYINDYQRKSLITSTLNLLFNLVLRQPDRNQGFN